MGVQDLGEGVGGGEMGGGGAGGGTAAGGRLIREEGRGRIGREAYKTQMTGPEVNEPLVAGVEVVLGSGGVGSEGMVGREWEGEIEDRYTRKV